MNSLAILCKTVMIFIILEWKYCAYFCWWNCEYVYLRCPKVAVNRCLSLVKNDDDFKLHDNGEFFAWLFFFPANERKFQTSSSRKIIMYIYYIDNLGWGELAHFTFFSFAKNVISDCFVNSNVYTWFKLDSGSQSHRTSQVM